MWFVYEQTQTQCLLSQGFNRYQVVAHRQYKKAGSSSNPIGIYSLADGIVRATH